MSQERQRIVHDLTRHEPVARASTGEQLTLDELTAGHQERAASPLRGSLLPPPSPPAPPRIPPSEQRVIRRSGVLALLAAAASVAELLAVDPVKEPLRAGGVALLCGATVALTVTPLLLIESYRRRPGLAQVRRRRAIRRGLGAGALVAGYMAFRVAGIGGPTWLLVATGLALVIEGALTRADGAGS
jgi:hypothetical protein